MAQVKDKIVNLEILKNYSDYVEDKKADKTVISSPYNFKGSCLFANLPKSGNTVNDTYYATDKKCKYTWNGSAWYQSSLNESDYTTELDGVITEKGNEVASTKMIYEVGQKEVEIPTMDEFRDNVFYDRNETLISDGSKTVTLTVGTDVNSGDIIKWGIANKDSGISNISMIVTYNSSMTTIEKSNLSGSIEGTFFEEVVDEEASSYKISTGATVYVINKGKNISNLAKDVGELKENINNVASKHINYLSLLSRIAGRFYRHSSTLINTTSGKEEIYDEILIKANTTYYYKNLYAYFCNIVYNDGTIVALSEDIAIYQSGTFTAEKDGKILITVNSSNSGQYFMFTDDEKFNKYYLSLKENIYEPNELRSLFVEPMLVGESNYEDILPDCNLAKNGGVYRLNFAKNATKFPQNSPFGNLYASNSVCFFMCFRRSNTTVLTGDYQLFISDNAIYARYYTSTSWGNWNIIAQKNEKANVPLVIVVDKNGGGDYTSLLKGILYATEFMDSTVYVRAGNYDLVSEFENYYGSDFFTNYSSSSVKGIVLKNRVKVIFSTEAHVTFDYKGNNDTVKIQFSPFNSGVYGFTLDNLHLTAINCRYGIHDEKGSVDTTEYKNVYKNCSIYIDNSQNTAWASRQCIGGGLGRGGNITIENCVFESVGIDNARSGIVSWHNNIASDAKSNMVITGNYFKGKGTFRLSWYGQSTEITSALVSNNSFGSAIQSRAETSNGTSPNKNIEIIEWNNVVRTE